MINIIENFMSLDVNINIHYMNRYTKFISSINETVEGYGERHHILPKSLFPQYKADPLNIKRIGAREHFIAHWMLARALPGCHRMVCAFHYMVNMNNIHQKRTYKITSMVYQELRKSILRRNKDMWSNKDTLLSHSKIMTEIANRPHILEKQSIRSRERLNDPIVKRKFVESAHTPEAREKSKNSNINTWKSEELRRRHSEIILAAVNTEQGRRNKKNYMDNTYKPYLTDSVLKSNNSLFAWKNAGDMYRLWSDNNYGYVKLSKHYNILEKNKRQPFQNIVERFKKGWNPNVDQHWIEWASQPTHKLT